MLGLPALTAPFVLATWLVLAFGWLDAKIVPRAGGHRPPDEPRRGLGVTSR